MRSLYYYSLTILLLLSLGGCDTMDVKDQPAPVKSADQALYGQAEQLIDAGEHAGAAVLFQRLAANSDDPNRLFYRLTAAEQYMLAEEASAAADIISSIRRPLSRPELAFRLRLLEAELALNEEQPEAAFERLKNPPPENVTLEQQLRYHRIKAVAFKTMGNSLEAATELSKVDPLLVELSPRLDNQFAIIETLAVLTDNALALFQPYPPSTMNGWMELTRVIKSNAGDNLRLQEMLGQWRDQFPEHPAMPELLGGYFSQLKAQYRKANHIAVLLPESGRFSKPAVALRDGIMAAYYQQPADSRPKLVFYDNSNPTNTWPLYQQAIDAGADMVIGPLLKNAVEQFARAGELEIPVLALNQVPPEVGQSQDLYQFSLSPEDEARQAAERAWMDSHRTAVALVPDSSWGDRILEAFRSHWENQGGILVEAQRYNSGVYDFSDPIKALLNLDESSSRRQRLQQLLGKKLEFTPRRRKDADVIFLASRPQTARQIRPQLQFHYAADLPVYTTSHVYGGSPNPRQDQDIEGLMFPDMPWILLPDSEDPLSREALSGFIQSNSRLYAMGMDSYRLIPHLARLQENPREEFVGATGKLYLDDLRQFHRRLVWARIEHGAPKVLGYSSSQEGETGFELPGSQSAQDEVPENTPSEQPPASQAAEG